MTSTFILGRSNLNCNRYPLGTYSPTSRNWRCFLHLPLPPKIEGVSCILLTHPQWRLCVLTNSCVWPTSSIPSTVFKTALFWRIVSCSIVRPIYWRRLGVQREGKTSAPKYALNALNSKTSLYLKSSFSTSQGTCYLFCPLWTRSPLPVPLPWKVGILQ